MRRIFTLGAFVVYPIIELIVIVAVARWTSWWFVLLALLIGVALGVVFLSRAGAGAARAFSGSVRTASIPAGDVGAHAMTFTGGLLFAVPGFLSDIAAVFFVFPPTQRRLQRVLGDRVTAWLRRRGFSPVKVTRPDGTHGTRISPGDIVEGEILDP